MKRWRSSCSSARYKRGSPRLPRGALGTNGVDAGPTCYDMRDVATRLKMDVSHVYKLAKRGELVSFRHGRAVRVRREDLEHFMHQRRIT